MHQNKVNGNPINAYFQIDEDYMIFFFFPAIFFLIAFGMKSSKNFFARAASWNLNVFLALKKNFFRIRNFCNQEFFYKKLLYKKL